MLHYADQVCCEWNLMTSI